MKDEPAFPRVVINTLDKEYHEPYQGLTKREYFAAMAMQGLLAHSAYSNGIEDAADLAVQGADALIESLTEGQE